MYNNSNIIIIVFAYIQKVHKRIRFRVHSRAPVLINFSSYIRLCCVVWINGLLFFLEMMMVMKEEVFFVFFLCCTWSIFLGMQRNTKERVSINLLSKAVESHIVIIVTDINWLPLGRKRKRMREKSALGVFFCCAVVHIYIASRHEKWGTGEHIFGMRESEFWVDELNWQI